MKRFKVALVSLLAVMLVCFSVPAFAAEPNCLDGNEAIKYSDMSAVSRAATSLVAQYHYTGKLTQGKVLGTFKLPLGAKTVSWTVGRTNSSGRVIIRLTNMSTGEVRDISATANNELKSMTWTSKLPAGDYEVSVHLVASGSPYDVDLYFTN